MSRFETPNHLSAWTLGMSVEAFETMCDREADFAAEVEDLQINLSDEDPRFVSEFEILAADLADEEDLWFVANLPVEGF